MARYKSIHKGLKLLPVDFHRQVIPGSFEHSLCYLVDPVFGNLRGNKRRNRFTPCGKTKVESQY